MSRAYLKNTRAYPNQRPKPKSKDQLVELQKEQRRLEEQAKLEERMVNSRLENIERLREQD